MMFSTASTVANTAAQFKILQRPTTKLTIQIMLVMPAKSTVAKMISGINRSIVEPIYENWIIIAGNSCRSLVSSICQPGCFLLCNWPLLLR